MQITQRMPKLKILLFYLVLLWIAYVAGTSIAYQNVRLLYLIMGLLILMIVPYIVSKIGLFPLFCILVFVYWIPLDSRLETFSGILHYVYPAEFGAWMLFLGIFIHRGVSPSVQWNSTIRLFPFLPFSLFIAGSLITLSISESYYGTLYALVRIRNFCLLPAFLCFLCIYLIKTEKQAEQLLWVFLISAGVLGLVFLYAPQIVSPDVMYELGVPMEETGRIRRIIKLPLFGLLEMSPATTPIDFAFTVALSFNLWLNHPSFRGRLVAAAILALSILVIIYGQGRAGLLAAVGSVVVITAMTLILKKYSSSLFIKSLLKPGIVLLMFFGLLWYYASISTIESYRLRSMTLLTDPFYAHSLSDYADRWMGGLEVFLHHPFGVGLYGYDLSPYGDTWHVHSLILYLLLSFGLIGFIGFFWIFVRYTKACWSGLHSDNATRQILCIGGIGCTTALFFGGIPAPMLWYPWEILMFWIPIGITMTAATLKDKV